MLRLARKELAILATAASLGGNPRATSLSICLTTISSLSLVRFFDLGQRSACRGRLARRWPSIARETL
jgi:hypothetical protein